MKPFAIDPGLLALPNPFPSPTELCNALGNAAQREREAFVRLWLSEGVPYAFRKCPVIFEYIRGWLGRELEVHPKEITLIGSARIGYSLARGSEFGKAFGENSDLDFSVISSFLFGRLVEEARLFSDHYRSGKISPRNDRESQFWSENINFFDRNICQGFLDGKKIPNFKCYPMARNINQSMWLLKEKLKGTVGAPQIRDASVRVYRDWQSFVDRVSHNLRATMRKESNAP